MLRLSAPIPAYQRTPPSVNWDHPPRFELGPPSPGYQGKYSLGVNLCFSTRLLGYFYVFLFFLVKPRTQRELVDPLLVILMLRSERGLMRLSRLSSYKAVSRKRPSGKNWRFPIHEFRERNCCPNCTVGNSIVEIICFNDCSTFSLSGGLVNNFYDLLPTMKSYAKTIVNLGGNNLS